MARLGRGAPNQIRTRAAAVPRPPSSGMTFWLKADSITGKVDGDALSSYTDQSPAANNGTNSLASPIYKTNIINALPVARFAGNHNWKLASHITDTVWSICAVGTKSSAGTYQAIIACQDESLYAQVTSDWGTYENTDINSGQALSTTFRIMTIVKRASNDIDLVQNGVLINRTNGSGNQSRPSPTTVGSNTNNTQQLNGDLAELITYNRALSTTERQAIESYLAAKYAITLTLAVFMPRIFLPSPMAVSQGASL